MSPPILIIGAGVSGLALAQGLRRRNIDFAVFERDGHLDSRLQGYRLKIAGDLLNQLRELLMEEAWGELEKYRGATVLGETTLNATDASVLASRRGNLPSHLPVPYTVDRGWFRRALMKGIEHFVYFNKQFVRYEEHGDGVVAVFHDGSVEHGRLLVGADGARSAVRKQFLPDWKILDTDSYCIYGKSPMGAELLERFPPAHRRWITVVRDQTPIIQSIISGDSPVCLVSEAVRFGKKAPESEEIGLPADYIHWGLMFRKGRLCLSEVEMTEALRSRPVALSLEITGEWHPSIRSLIELQEPSLTAGMPVYSASPEMKDWAPSAVVTVMGDAIHLQSPSGAVGAVAALDDAVSLAMIISEQGVSAESNGRYEERMRRSARVCLERSFRAGAQLVGMPCFRECKEVHL